jgi:hypothetical protein
MRWLDLKMSRSRNSHFLCMTNRQAMDAVPKKMAAALQRWN